MRSHRTLLPEGVSRGLESLICSVFILGWHWCKPRYNSSMGSGSHESMRHTMASCPPIAAAWSAVGRGSCPSKDMAVRTTISLPAPAALSRIRIILQRDILALVRQVVKTSAEMTWPEPKRSFSTRRDGSPSMARIVSCTSRGRRCIIIAMVSWRCSSSILCVCMCVNVVHRVTQFSRLDVVAPVRRPSSRLLPLQHRSDASLLRRRETPLRDRGRADVVLLEDRISEQGEEA